MTKTRAAICLIILLACSAVFADVRVFQIGNQVRGDAARALGLAKAIQTQRADLLRTNCEAQNDRHDKTIIALNRELDAAIKHTPAAQRQAIRVQIRASQTYTIQLIDALAPRQKCDQVVARGMKSREGSNG